MTDFFQLGQTIKLTEEQINELMGKKAHLAKQTYEQIIDSNPQSKHVISRQATINIGTIGHVAHGKSTLVKAISGVNTVKFNEEKLRNITIKLGYANAKIFKCPKCENPTNYFSFGSNVPDIQKCKNCQQEMELKRHISFVDCPGHDILMATMLAGAAVMDACILVVSANNPQPQPQTIEHLAAIEIIEMSHVIIAQNKIDLVFKNPGEAEKNRDEIKQVIQSTCAENSPIVPISAQLKYNIEAVLYYICEYLPIPKRLIHIQPKLMIIRSFDINKPGTDATKIQGGVVGGSIIQGVLKIGDRIEIRPGTVIKDNGKTKYQPIISRITSLKAEENELLFAIPGGLIGVGTKIDPSLTKSNKLSGNLLGYEGYLPNVYDKLIIKYELMRKLVGVKQDKQIKVDKVKKIQIQETLMLNIGSTNPGGKVIETTQDQDNNTFLTVSLIQPVCCQEGEKVALSRKINKNWRLIGQGTIMKCCDAL